jgi:ABC-type taurine transport system ATPase subunit
LAGQPIVGPGPDRGVVFQQPALFPWMSVAQNAEFGPMVRGIDGPTRHERVEHFLRLVGLWDFRNHYPYQLSGGMQQRLAIVRALANEPKVLLMDEPFGALDALTREKMQEELHAVWRRTRMTVVFITHSVEEAVYLGTEVIVMSARPGRILKQIKVGFSRVSGERDSIRSIKASAEFVATREQILGLIWS